MVPSRRLRTRRAARRCTEPPRRRRRRLLAVLGGAALVAAGCGVAKTTGGDAARAWADGPVRWLLLPDERTALRGVTSSADLTAFLQTFWLRRDDDPRTAENPLGDVYAQRVADADRLYAEDGVRGSLTDRGGALLLLGPPSLLAYSAKAAPTREGRDAAGPRHTRPVRLEIWTYVPDDLTDGLRRLRLQKDPDAGDVALTFLIGPQHTRLIEGREVLELAACAWARCADAPP